MQELDPGEIFRGDPGHLVQFDVLLDVVKALLLPSEYSGCCDPCFRPPKYVSLPLTTFAHVSLDFFARVHKELFCRSPKTGF